MIPQKSRELFDELQYAKSWRTDSEFVFEASKEKVNPNQTQLRCQSSKLYPSHPYQSTKEYHAAMRADYNHTKLPADSRACQTPNPTRRFCLRAGAAKLLVMSDLYVDECGHHYRGYWLTSYMSLDESMGTLFAKGRTAYPRPGSTFRGDYVTGNTYEVREKDFVYLTPLESQDRAKLNQALSGIERFFTKKDRLFFRARWRSPYPTLSF